MSDIKEKTLKLIDGLKATCQSYGMGNDGNEYKIITQVFLYKFLNDKFGYELKNAKIRWPDSLQKVLKSFVSLIQSYYFPRKIKDTKRKSFGTLPSPHI